MAQNRQDIKKRFSVPLKGSQNKVFPVKKMPFKIFIFPKFSFFANFSKKNHVLSFLLTLASVISMVHSDSFLTM